MGFFNILIPRIFSNKPRNSTINKIEGYIQTCESLYNMCVSLYPDKDPHEHLSIALGLIWIKSGAFKENELDKPSQSQEIVAYTLLPACLPPHYRARVLAYKLIMEDKELSSRLITEYPDYYEEYSKISKSLWKAKRNGSLKKLYRRYNKNIKHQKVLFPPHNGCDKKKRSFKNRKRKDAHGNIISEVSSLIGQASKTLTQQRVTFFI